MTTTDFNGLPPAGALQASDVLPLQRGVGADSTKRTTVGEGQAAIVVTDANTTYTVLAADVSIYRRLTAATAKTITVGPDSGEALPANYEQHFDNDGAGSATFVAGSGVTIKPASDGSLIVPQNGVVTLKRLAANIFRLVGITEAP